MRRTLLGCCADCKYSVIFTQCVKSNCDKCPLHTVETRKGSGCYVNLDEEEFEYTKCLCLCDATGEEIRTNTCKYKEEYNVRKLQNC